MRMTRHIAFFALVIALVAVPSAVAAPVERATPFTDYRQATADQYGTPPGGGVAPGGTGNVPPTITGPTTTVTAPPEGGTGPDTGANEPAGTTAPVSGSAGSRLPFTGFNLLLVILIGASLVAAGAFLRVGERLRIRSSRSAA